MHPSYGNCPDCGTPGCRFGMQPAVLIGDEVALSADDHREPLGTVTDVHGESFGDGPGDTITVLPAAVTLSTGDRYPVADLVLLRRADQ
ncbi:MAG: hypothetical protein R2761_16110 [Acidimicrobiales bacterium]